MILYIVRHGQTEENIRRMLQGHLPGKLTEEGKEQVRKVAERLAKENIPFKCIVTSDLKRAVDSANIIAERLSLPVIPMKILRERDWGKYTGMPLLEAAEKFKKDGKWVFPDGDVESEAEIYERAERALELLKEEYKEDAIIAVTHGQFARNLIAARFKCPVGEVASFINAEIRTLKL